jgi:hypothetical protein
MAHIGFRVDDETHKLMKEYARRMGTTVTNLFKEHINTILSDNILSINSDWQVKACEFFGLRLSRFQHFLSRAKTPIEFFAHINGFCDTVNIMSLYDKDNYKLQVETKGVTYIVSVSRSEMKVSAIRRLCEQIENKLFISLEDCDV